MTSRLDLMMGRLQFCPTCGACPLVEDGPDSDMYAINVRCLEDVGNIWDLKVLPYAFLLPPAAHPRLPYITLDQLRRHHLSRCQSLQSAAPAAAQPDALRVPKGLHRRLPLRRRARSPGDRPVTHRAHRRGPL